MYLKFDKVSEDTNSVSYRIETEARDLNSFTNSFVTVYATCIFDKFAETITYDPQATDSFYIQRQLEPLYILIHLKKLNKKKRNFPDKYCIATGG